MDTSGLESFAQTLRTELLSGVRQRLRYWGFADDGSVEEAPEAVEGGYLFRGEVHDDPGVPTKWRALKKAVNRHDVAPVAEEAAYTWFNRLVALRILEKNGYVPDTLGYAEETTQPAVLYRARQGVIDVLSGEEEQDVRAALLESDDDRAFRQLLIGVCHDNDLLNDVFGRLRDYTELLLPTGLLDREGPVDRLVTTDAISDEDYEQVELIGWLYQFYISEKKDEVYDSSGKFEPEDIPAATQIFTPHWIVRYMVENTIGKQWLEKYPDSPLREEMEYLVENAGSDVSREPRNGTEGDQMEVFDEEDDGDPTAPIFDDLSELELFDPAAGSGHILVVGFDLLMEMYRERGYTDREAVEQVLTENLKGLEIDRRAAQLARFALLMKAAQYDRRALDRDALRPEVYAMPEPRTFSTGDLRAYLGDDVFDAYGAEIKEALDLIAEHGQNVGSALKLELSNDARRAVAEKVVRWDEKTQNGTAQLDEQALHQELRGYLKALLLSTGDYPAVAMNPPYMGSRQMNSELKSYVKGQYPQSKSDLFAVFMEVGEQTTCAGGRLGMINQHSWMFLSSYKDLRKYVLETTLIESMMHLGPHTFDEIGGEVVQSTAFTIGNVMPNGKTGTYFRLVDEKSSISKKKQFEERNKCYNKVDQREFRKIPGSPVAYWCKKDIIDLFEKEEKERNYYTKTGMQTGNTKKYVRAWYEVSGKDVGKMGSRWNILDKGGSFRKWYGNIRDVVYWEDNGRDLKKDDKSSVSPEKDFFREHISWSLVSSNNYSFRYFEEGYIFDIASALLFDSSKPGIYSKIALLNSSVSDYLAKVLNPTMNLSSGVVAKFPIIDCRKSIPIARECISVSRNDWNEREASWDFTQHPLVQQNTASLEEAYDSWKQQSTDDFLQLHANEEELNDLFIDLYGLENELSPRVALDDITILEDELDRDALETLDDERDELSDEELRTRFLDDDPDDALFQVEVPIRQFLSYGIGVMLGRYRLSRQPSGLHIAHPNPSEGELAPYDVPVPLSGDESQGTETFEIDDDAIVPLMGRDSPFSDDAVHRMRDVVRLIWGEETLTENLNFINHALSVGRSRGLKRDYEKTMEAWLVGDFWDWHKSLYSVPYYGKKPIYWLFQSPEGHFQVLVYMHRMDKYTPQRVRQDYLQRYQEYLRREISDVEQEGEETLSTDQSKRLDTLRAAAADCREYDAILKDVADEQIEIDLDDGVQNNYPKFGDAVADL
jgi:hypothetical protein